MKQVHFIITNYADSDISKIPFNEYDEICETHGYEASYYIVSNKKQAECERAQSFVFENDNENSAISRALTGLSGSVVVMSAKYMDRVDVIEEFIEALSYNCHVVRVKRAFRGIASVVGDALGVVYNIFVKLFTGAHDVMCVKNFVAFSGVVLELINMFPNKYGLMANSNFLANLNTHEILIDEEFKPVRNKLAYKRELVFGIITSILSVACLVLVLTIKLSLNVVLWLIIGMLVFALLGATFCSKNALDNKMLCKTKKSKVKKTEQNDKQDGAQEGNVQEEKQEEN